MDANKIDKVFEGLERCMHKKDSDTCVRCPYFTGCGASEYGSFTELAYDAYELLDNYEETIEKLEQLVGLYAEALDLYKSKIEVIEEMDRCLKKKISILENENDITRLDLGIG